MVWSGTNAYRLNKVYCFSQVTGIPVFQSLPLDHLPSIQDLPCPPEVHISRCYVVKRLVIMVVIVIIHEVSYHLLQFLAR